MRNVQAIDELDRAIIDVLREDGRLSNAELARRVGLTPAPCLRRVQRMEAEGVITGYHAHVDPAAAGRGMEVIVSVEITMTTQAIIEEFERAVASFDEVLEVRKVFGLPDYFLRVAVADANAYETFQMTKLSGLRAVHRVVSHQTMKVIKNVR